MNRIRYTLLVGAVFLALLLSAITTVPVFADEATPPPDTTTTEEVVTEETPPVLTEESVPVEEAESSPETEESVSELIESLPADTEVIVINEVGETIPLASEEAAQAVAFIDPVWCPVGVSPKTDNTGGCTIAYGTLKELIDAIMTGSDGAVQNANGVIWIQAGADSSTGSMILDGSDVDLGTMENFSLTLQGGWNGVHNSTVITAGTTTISDSLAIINWNGDITIKDIVFSGVAVGSANDAALDITTTKKISLINVDVDSNTGAGVIHGARLYNNDGVVASDVIITNSTFTNNKNIGLIVRSDGAITITNLVANSNGEDGAQLNNIDATTPKPVTIKGTVNQTKFNMIHGLLVYSDGAVTINSLTSNNNNWYGAIIDNTTGTGAVTLTGINTFRENGKSGLEVFSDGAITINSLAANDNGQFGADGYGAWLQNDTAATPMAVKLTGNNEFYSNYDGGLVISSDGMITVNNLTASWNTDGFGADLRNNANNLMPQNVTITGYSNTTNNSGYGMYIDTYGIVSLIKVTADNNTGFGLQIDNYLSGAATLVKGVTISGKNSFSYNSGGNGLTINSIGAITLNNVIADGNSAGHGVFLENDFAGAVGGITITALPSGSWNQFSGNAGSGLVALSKGNITVAITDANDNGSNGVYLDNNEVGATGNVTFGAGGKPNWCNSLWSNYYDGLYISSNGTVTLTSICADSNGDSGDPSPYGNGVFIDNSTSITPKAVTLLGDSSANYSYNNGFYIITNGAVTLNKIYTDGNGEYGLYVDNNTNSAVPQNVTLNGYGDFNNNGYGGLHIETFGVVTLNNVYAENNGDNGVYVDNATGATLAKAVTIKGYVNAYSNSGTGLYVNSLGAITLANLDANGNNSGTTLTNNLAPTPMPVTITGNAFTSFNDVTHGMLIQSKGAITVNVTDSWAGGNATFGWHLNNAFVGAVGGVTLTPATGYSIDFWDNGTHGLLVESLGAIKVTNLDSSDNGTYGATLDNSFVGSVGTITILPPTSGNNYYNGNGETGLSLYSNRAITVSNLWSEFNGGDGVFIDNSYSGSASPQPVTINGPENHFDNNGNDGLEVYSFGVITTNNLNAYANGQNLGSEGWGAILDNCVWNGSSCNAVTPKAMMLKGTNVFNDNYYTGLSVRSLGAITANNITASGNGGVTNYSGAYLDNQYDAGFFGITLTGSNSFDSNGYIGLWIYSNGAVTINNLSTNWNGDNGTYIDSYNMTKQAVVKITGNNYFLGNGGTGLFIAADAAVTLSNIMANWNGVNGAYINNYDIQGGAWDNSTLTITGINNFNGNGETGLGFLTYSTVTLSNITADNNDRDVTDSPDGNGVDGYSYDSSITISCGSMTDNEDYGWVLDAFTTVTLKGVFATGNLTGNGNLIFGSLVIKRTCP